jgi:hypothetical protein
MTGAKMNLGTVVAIGWGLTYLALAGVIGMELDWGRRIHPSLPMPKLAPAARVDYPVQPEFSLLPLEQGFAETTARPVFTPVRRPPPPPAPPAPPKPAMQKGQFVLLGALITKDKSVAVLRDVASGKAMRVEQGKEIKGITVANIYPEKVVLTQYDDSEELVLKIQPMLPKPAPSAPPAQTGQPAQAAQPAPGAAGGGDPNSVINRRRAVRGLPPI